MDHDCDCDGPRIKKQKIAMPTPHSPTPTPWHTTYSSEDATFITDDHGKSIAVIPEDGGTPENIANAAYIVKAVNAYAALQAENAELRETLQGAKTMTNELLKNMDDGHWYHDDLVALRVRIIQALTRPPEVQ